MNTELVAKTEEFLKKKFDDSEYFKAHPDEKAYRLEHSYRVANIGKTIAQKEGFDETEMVIACLLHDVSYCDDFGEDGWKDHGRNAARIARPFLKELGLPEERHRRAEVIDSLEVMVEGIIRSPAFLEIELSYRLGGKLMID